MDESEMPGPSVDRLDRIGRTGEDYRANVRELVEQFVRYRYRTALYDGPYGRFEGVAESVEVGGVENSRTGFCNLVTVAGDERTCERLREAVRDLLVAVLDEVQCRFVLSRRRVQDAPELSPDTVLGADLPRRVRAQRSRGDVGRDQGAEPPAEPPARDPVG